MVAPPNMVKPAKLGSYVAQFCNNAVNDHSTVNLGKLLVSERTPSVIPVSVVEQYQ
jgi:hypothetical protein